MNIENETIASACRSITVMRLDFERLAKLFKAHADTDPEGEKYQFICGIIADCETHRAAIERLLAPIAPHVEPAQAACAKETAGRACICAHCAQITWGGDDWAGRDHPLPAMPMNSGPRIAERMAALQRKRRIAECVINCAFVFLATVGAARGLAWVFGTHLHGDGWAGGILAGIYLAFTQWRKAVTL